MIFHCGKKKVREIRRIRRGQIVEKNNIAKYVSDQYIISAKPDRKQRVSLMLASID